MTLDFLYEVLEINQSTIPLVIPSEHPTAGIIAKACIFPHFHTTFFMTTVKSDQIASLKKLKHDTSDYFLLIFLVNFLLFSPF